MSYSLKSLALAVAGVGVLAASTASAQNLTFMTGPAGGTWYPLGGAMKGIFEDNIDGVSVNIRPGAGLINIRGVAEGRADLGMGNVISTVDGINGQPPFENEIEGLCNLAALYQQYAQGVSVNSDVRTYEDLAGRNFATLPRGNTTEVAAQMLLEAAGLSYDDLGNVNFASLTDQVNMAKDGQVAAIFNVTSIPSGSMLDLANSRRTYFLPVSDGQFDLLRERNAGWVRTEIPANSYPNQPEAVPLAGFPMHVIVHCDDMPEELGYQLAKVLAENVQDLGSVHRGLAEFTVEDMAIDVGVPLHPGAERYYREQGAL